MKSVFLAFAFRDPDRNLAANVQRLLATHELSAVTGERLGGEALTPAVKERIEQTDAFIALLTRREKKAGGWLTHPWVLDEISHARANKKPSVALVEEGVKVEGAYADHEFIPLNTRALLPAFLSLAETICLWKRKAGRTLRILLGPEAVARLVASGDANVKCRYRSGAKGKFNDWCEATPSVEGLGTFLYVNGIGDDHLVQLQVQGPKGTWESIAREQWLPIDVLQKG